ncbi:MAG: hypothetical protein COV44_10710 [Deltaproteobacteria bacterium CG11_big_fil_rev_8_21_14_0_20_45_16]|nr:MAG: hypothetical protein COV44_10710 [Deltaproteobacteria bacterium CG11_big_fil_rev_8_21_14_0_20_45_16]
MPVSLSVKDRLRPLPPQDQAVVDSFWESSLLNETYLRTQFPHDHKEIWNLDLEPGPFYDFFNGFLNLCAKSKDRPVEQWNEANTIALWIKEVLDLLGWRKECCLEQEAFTKTDLDKKRIYKPDLIYFEEPGDEKYLLKERDSELRLAEARNCIDIVVEAKYWNRLDEYYHLGRSENSERKSKVQADSVQSFEPDEQCFQYMQLLNTTYGILTDGKVWRLLHKELSDDPSVRKSYQFDLGDLRELALQGLSEEKGIHRFLVAAKMFFHIFSRNALVSPDGRDSLVDKLVFISKTYVDQVEEDLKERFISAMTFACNGLLQSSSLKNKVGLETVRNVAESHLFNILFIKYCESKRILPIHIPAYHEISLTRIISDLDTSLYDPERDDRWNYRRLADAFGTFRFKPEGTELYDKLLDLTKLIHGGLKKKLPDLKFEIDGFKESVYSKDEWKFAIANKLTNQYMVKVLFQLGFAKSNQVRGKKYQQIPYNSFSPRQLGSIYESFLEFELNKAHVDLAFIKKKWVERNLNHPNIVNLDIPKAPKGSLYFLQGNAARKDTGSYYTPDHIAQFIVEKTIGPLIKDIEPHQIFQIKVCDPAMGSSHFLNSAINFLASRYVALCDEHSIDSEFSTSYELKREILDQCIFGVDINPRAVKLAKMALWLETAFYGKKLENLDDQIKCGDSLRPDIFNWEKEFKKVFNVGGFDAFIGNPPYLGEKGHKKIFDEVKETAFGKKFYSARMDYFYYFIHLGLDLLRANGRLGFVTTNYFLTASGATKLRKDLKDRAELKTLLDFGAHKIFKDASGQHNIVFTLKKIVDHNGDCEVFSTESFESEASLKLGLKSLKPSKTIKSSALFEGGECFIRLPNVSAQSSGDSDQILKQLVANSDADFKRFFKINQGVVSGCNRLTERHLDEYPGIKGQKGDGIFILTGDEVQRLRLSEEGKKRIIRPYFKNSDIGRFSLKAKNKYWLLLTNVITDLREFPSVKAHLEKFAPIIKGRSQMEHCLDWWDLHQIRMKDKNKTGSIKKMIFDGPKLVCPQRGKQMTFGYGSGEWYAGSDVFFITSLENSTSDRLKYLLGLLNSDAIAYWYYFKGKKKGEYLEMASGPISNTPFPKASSAQMSSVVAVVDKLIKKPSDQSNLNKLNELVFTLFGLSKGQAAKISSFVLNNIKSD